MKLMTTRSYSTVCDKEQQPYFAVSFSDSFDYMYVTGRNLTPIRTTQNDAKDNLGPKLRPCSY